MRWRSARARGDLLMSGRRMDRVSIMTAEGVRAERWCCALLLRWEVPEGRCQAMATALQLHVLGELWVAAASMGAAAGARSGSLALTDNEANSAVETTEGKRL